MLLIEPAVVGLIVNEPAPLGLIVTAPVLLPPIVTVPLPVGCNVIVWLLVVAEIFPTIDVVCPDVPNVKVPLGACVDGRSAETNALNVGVPVDPSGPAKTVFAVSLANVAVNVPDPVTGDPETEKIDGNDSATDATEPPAINDFIAFEEFLKYIFSSA